MMLLSWKPYLPLTTLFLTTLTGNSITLPPKENSRDLWIGEDNLGPQVPISHVKHRPSSTCADPSVRKEWRSMTRLQKDAWIQAVKCLESLPSSGELMPTGEPPDDALYAFPPVNKSASAYDDFAYIHMDMNNRAHQTGLFLPWHRYFVWSFEQTLKQHCGYRGFTPYWNWTKDANDFLNASIFDTDPQVGLGGFGVAADDYAVPNGAFAGFRLSYPSPHVLRREYSPYPYLNLTRPLYTNPGVPAASTFVPEEVQQLVSGFRGNYKGFQTYLESTEGMHMSIHFIMGGDIGGLCPRQPFSKCASDSTPNDPMFWMHHAMVDKIWFDWQHAHPSNYRAFEGGTLRDLNTWPMYPVGKPPAMTVDMLLPTDGVLLGNYSVGDMFNTTSNGPLCYTYS